MPATIADRVQEIVAKQLGKPAAQCGIEDTLDALGFDDLDRFEMAINLEQEFGVEINSDKRDIFDLITVGDVVGYVVELQAERAAVAGGGAA